MTKPRIDLHLHSYFSDGELSPTALMEECGRAGLKVAALTDHEHLGGLTEFAKAGERFRVKTIPGVEISTRYVSAKYGKTEQDVLGLGIDIQNKQLLEFLERCQNSRIAQLHSMVEKLHALGIKVDFAAARQKAPGTMTIRHIAQAVFENPENERVVMSFVPDSELMSAQNSHSKIFGSLFSPSDGIAFVKRCLPNIKDAIEAITAAGGVAVWAHPLWRTQTSQFIENSARIFKAWGLEAIEVFYPLHDEEGAFTLHRIARKLNLLESAGSDFHSPRATELDKVFSWNNYGIDADFSWAKIFLG